MTKFDFIQVFINGSAIAGVIALWIELTKRAIRTVWSLADNEPLYDSSSDWSDDCIEESPQIPKPPPPYQSETD